MLDTKSYIKSPDNAKQASFKKGPRIVFKNVNFSYGHHKILDEINFEIKPGEVAALVGPSGGGKSTIMNLVPRLFDVEGGKVTINGTDVRDYDIQSLRDTIALVSQEISIFDDTIRANIAYGRQGASEQDIINAAKAAAAHDFICKLPDGYDTRVGEQGVKLSGGQRQRIAIARAMLRDAKIILLDEATSALDRESERSVQKALNSLQHGRTTLIIAHRLSTVEHADKIIVVEGGRILEEGPHAVLKKRGGAYTRLYGIVADRKRERDNGADEAQILQKRKKV